MTIFGLSFISYFLNKIDPVEKIFVNFLCFANVNLKYQGCLQAITYDV